MIKRILFIVLAIIVLIVLWSVFQSFRGSPGNVAGNLFEVDFLSSISRHVTSGLALSDETSPAQVSLEELGEFSPVAGMIEIVQDVDTVSIDDIVYEYIEIRAKKTNAEAINISNWSLQSMVSDIWIGIPQGVELYIVGEVNELQDIYLRPGESAVIATRQSPVGVSFRVNRCSGFLSDTQNFEPPLRTICMDPREVLPPTVENIKSYDDECVRFVENFGRCSYVTSTIEGFTELSQACRDKIQPRFTYNYCSSVHANDSDFYDEKNWRIFLNQDKIIWKENYEIIRLLDEKHRTVDVFNY